MPFLNKLHELRELVRINRQYIDDSHPNFTLFFSVSDGSARAHVINVSGHSLEAAWQKGLTALRDTLRKHHLQGKWLRIDWVEDVEAMTWRTLRDRLHQTKRNYFRHGLALDPNLETAFLEQELNANAMLYGGNKIEHAVINEKNFEIYAKSRFERNVNIDFSEESLVFVLSTRGVFCDEAGGIRELDASGPNAGRRHIGQLSGDDAYSLISSSSSFLARQVKQDGSFIYGYHPCFDRQIEAYNTLRHASTTYAMIEAWELTDEASLKASIDRSLEHLTQTLIRTVTLPDGTEAAFLVDVGNEIKLGGNAVAILALAKYSRITNTETFLPLLERLALGIRFMQDRQSGAFVHVLNASDLSVKAKFRTIYYEGEAAFGLMRLYGLTRDARWLEMVERAFGHFIAENHWKHHDHWLGYCVNELTRYRPEERYFRFGIRNVSNYLDFVLERITTFPTLLELMMAAREMLTRIDETPRLHHLLAEIDLDKFRRALEFRAHHLLNGHFWPEVAMYFRNPDRILGSFFIRHHAFRVRIDDVEHYLSGFVAYRKYLEVRPEFDRLIRNRERLAIERTKEQAALPAATSDGLRGWSSMHVEAATQGKWTTPPPENWSATGLCIYAPAMQPGNLVVARTSNSRMGVLPPLIKRMRPPPSGIITTDPDQVQDLSIPSLHVGDTGEAILAMGRYARTQMTGNILAVTGSAGKTTTVAMLAHVLSAGGEVGKSAHNANLPHGVGWNLASIGWDTPHTVLELAIGRMAVSARMARPHVAVFTNILPAHLGASSTVADIARAKSAIFLGMSKGDTAVLNRDMLEWGMACEAAKARGLKILHYGASDDCDFQLLDYLPDRRWVTARILGRRYQYRIGAAGRHMAMNGLAVLAAVSALGHQLEPAISQLASFSALPGRGVEWELTFDGRRLTVIDDAYNANPGSMKVALDRLDQEKSTGRRIAVLGQMAELGPGGEAYHTELAQYVRDRAIDRFYITGELYAGFWAELPASRQGRYAASLDELKTVLRDELADGDVVLFKGSNSTRIHEVVAWIKENSQVEEEPRNGSKAVAATRPAQIRVPAAPS